MADSRHGIDPGRPRRLQLLLVSLPLEHLGSLHAGVQFVERSMATLRPRGVAMYTTEFNLDSDNATPTDGPTVLYRRRDLVDLAERIERAGHEMALLDLDRGYGVLDEFIDVPPFTQEPLIRLAFGNTRRHLSR